MKDVTGVGDRMLVRAPASLRQKKPKQFEATSKSAPQKSIVFIVLC